MSAIAIIRGGGDLASGVAFRLHRAGLRVLIAELPQPLVVRRLASFAQAVYTGEYTLEGVTAHLAVDLEHAEQVWEMGRIAVVKDPRLEVLRGLQPLLMVDARMTKRPPDLRTEAASLVIGLGPGFTAGKDCHAVIETMRGHFLGRVIWQGSAQADTGVPGGVGGHQKSRVLRSPADGVIEAHASIGDRVNSQQVLAEVAGKPILAPFDGVLRGLIYPGLQVKRGLKVGDVDPRADPNYCTTISDKALAIGGGVLEALLAKPDIRSQLWLMT